MNINQKYVKVLCLFTFNSTHGKSQVGYGMNNNVRIKDLSGFIGKTIKGDNAILKAFVLNREDFESLKVIPFGGDIMSTDLINLFHEGLITIEGPTLPKS